MTMATATISPPSACRIRGARDAHRAQGHSPLRADREEQEDDARAERIGKRHEDALDREALRRGEHGDRRDHRARAGREEQAEADAEEEAASHSSGVAPAERLERPLDDGAEPRPEQRDPDEQNDPDGDVAEQVVREAERREERGRDQGEEREAPDEPGDDRVRPPPVAGGPAREDDRQDRQDARRDRGDDARDERDSDEQAHVYRRQREGDARAAARAVLGPDAAALRLDEAAGDREPEARRRFERCPRRVAAPEALEHPLRAPRRREPVAGVLDRDHDLLGRRLRRRPRPSRRTACAAARSSAG